MSSHEKTEREKEQNLSFAINFEVNLLFLEGVKRMKILLFFFFFASLYIQQKIPLYVSIDGYMEMNMCI